MIFIFLYLTKLIIKILAWISLKRFETILKIKILIIHQKFTVSLLLKAFNKRLIEKLYYKYNNTIFKNTNILVNSSSMCVLSLSKTSSMNTTYLFYKIDLLILSHNRHCKFHLCDCKSGFVNSSHTFQSISHQSVHLDMLQLGISITWV